MNVKVLDIFSKDFQKYLKLIPEFIGEMLKEYVEAVADYTCPSQVFRVSRETSQSNHSYRTFLLRGRGQTHLYFDITKHF